MRLSLLALRRLRSRIERENPANSDTRILDEYLEICSRMLESIGSSLLSGDAGGAAIEDLQKLESVTEQLRERNPVRAAVAEATIFDARSQMDAFAGQIRSALDLATHATPAGVVAFERREARKPWGLQLRGSLAILRANLTLESAACSAASGDPRKAAERECSVSSTSFANTRKASCTGAALNTLVDKPASSAISACARR